MIKPKYLVCLTLVFLIPAYSTILMRNTFETYEGDTPQECGWTDTSHGDGFVVLYEESTDPYQTQTHGRYSLRIYDPNNNSYANAYKTFSNSSSEYMTELYIWIGSNHTAPIDSFPLCVLWNIPALGLPAKTDIALVIDTLNNPPNGGIFTIHVEDADSIHHNEVYIDSTDRWYKIQIYRHISGSDTVVTLYLDGDSIDTYVPMNKDKVSNKISLGTTQADSLADGEVFYDDFIIIDYSDRKNKITAIKDTNQKDMLSFLSEANDYFSRINPYLIHKNYHYFRPEDVYYVVSLSNLSNATLEDLSNYERLSYFNELIVRLDQIKLGLLYGNLNETEKDLIRRTFDFCIVDIKDNDAYNMITKKEWK